MAVLIIIAAHLMKNHHKPEDRGAFFRETWWLTKRIFSLLAVDTFITMIAYIRVIGLKKSGTYIVLVVLMPTLAGMIYGAIA